MKAPLFRIKIIDQDIKSERQGTIYKITYSFNNISGVLLYSILDEVNNTERYKEYCNLYSSFLSAKKDFDKYINESSAELNMLVKQQRLQNNSLSDLEIQFIKESLKDFDSLIIEYKKGKEKALNSLVGKLLGKGKQASFNFDPLVLKNELVIILG